MTTGSGMIGLPPQVVAMENERLPDMAVCQLFGA